MKRRLGQSDKLERLPGQPSYREVMHPIVELDGLEVRFGSRVILKQLKASLTGRSIGLLGPNGAGKSTLLNTLLGFHQPSAGTARILGRDIRTHAGEVRSLIGYMPENDAFIAAMSGVHFVRLMAELAGLPPRARPGARPRSVLLRGPGRSPLPRPGHLLAGHEAGRQAGAGHRARAQAAVSRRADQRARPAGAHAHDPAHPGNPRPRRSAPDPLLAPAARRGRVLRPGADPQRRQRGRLLQPGRGAPRQPPLPGNRNARRAQRQFPGGHRERWAARPLPACRAASNW